MGAHADSANDGDHKCDYCGAILTSCADSDKDHDCDECGTIISSHSYENGYCTVCGEKEWVYTRIGLKITFGSYPQTKVTDAGLTSTLNSKAGTLPTSSNSQAWTSYGYYIDGNVENFMWYIDVTNGNDKYRGVYFTSYRPFLPRDFSSADNTKQDDNGYTIGNVYWFKYEPISWTILSEDTANGTALILCDMIIDSQQYNYDGFRSNNYAESTIRKWLNENFYNTAFNDLQKQIILTTTVDNSAASGYGSAYCENTQDNIFLLSYQEAINADYGFSSDYSEYDTARQKKATDYAQAQGASISTSTDYAGNGVWILRSHMYDSWNAYGVSYGGWMGNNSIDVTSEGVVPALQIRLS